MNNIKALITKLSSVDYKELNLSECSEIKRGVRVTKSQLANDKPYPVYSGGVTPMGYFDNFNQDENTITIVKYGTAGFVNFILEKFWANDVCYCIKPSELLINKFLYFVLKNQQDDIYARVNRDAVPAHLQTEEIETIKVPVPPLEVQKEIVRILENFTQLEAELEAELEARTQQYEYYRNKLLDFSTGFVGVPKIDMMIKELCPGGVDIKTLKDIGKVKMCKRIFKEQTTIQGDIPFYKIGTFGSVPDSYISEKIFLEYKNKYPYPKIGDVLVSAAGTIGKTVVFDGKPSYFQDSNIVWLENDETLITNRYLLYFYSLGKWNKAEGGTIDRLYNDIILHTEIHVPPKLIQNEIVKILDSFSDLVNSISEGIPAEIKARKKQYEYYRNKLFTFKERK
jgi:type I restriction enzyme, S subunit